MCSLHFLESSGRTVVTAWRWPASVRRAFSVRRREPRILIGYLGWRRRDKSSSSYLNCIDWLPVSSHPPLNLPPTPLPSHRSPVSQTSRFLPLANRIQQENQRPSLPLLFGWIGVTRRGGSCRGNLPCCNDTPLPPSRCFPNQSAGWEKQFSGQRLAGRVFARLS